MGPLIHNLYLTKFPNLLSVHHYRIGYVPTWHVSPLGQCSEEAVKFAPEFLPVISGAIPYGTAYIWIESDCVHQGLPSQTPSLTHAGQAVRENHPNLCDIKLLRLQG